MIEIKPKEESMWPGFLTVFIPIILIFALVFGYFSFDKKVRAVARSHLATAYFLNDYVPEVEARLEQIANQMELAETIVPIYERRLSEVENWKEKSCFTYCGKGKYETPKR